MRHRVAQLERLPPEGLRVALLPQRLHALDHHLAALHEARDGPRDGLEVQPVELLPARPVGVPLPGEARVRLGRRRRGGRRGARRRAVVRAVLLARAGVGAAREAVERPPARRAGVGAVLHAVAVFDRVLGGGDDVRADALRRGVDRLERAFELLLQERLGVGVRAAVLVPLLLNHALQVAQRGREAPRPQDMREILQRAQLVRQLGDVVLSGGDGHPTHEGARLGDELVFHEGEQLLAARAMVVVTRRLAVERLFVVGQLVDVGEGRHPRRLGAVSLAALPLPRRGLRPPFLCEELIGVVALHLDVLLNGRQQPVPLDWLRDEVSHARREALLLVPWHRVRSERHDGEMALRPLLRQQLSYPPRRLVAVHHGHVAVHQDKVVWLLGGVRRLPHLHTLQPVHRHLYRVPRVLQHGADHLYVKLVVFHNEYLPEHLASGGERGGHALLGDFPLELLHLGGGSAAGEHCEEELGPFAVLRLDVDLPSHHLHQLLADSQPKPNADRIVHPLVTDL
mmetsp:Transcript_27994/g.67791  ORF Transcript_27994/g.67791 Transcript_27994/m.67791 type:complete len:512 (-) Transcript_27994:2381-3916(-)